MLEKLLDRIGGIPDRLVRDGLLVDGRKNRLSRDAYAARLEFYLADQFQRERQFFAAQPRSAPAARVQSRQPFSGGEEILLRFPSAYEPVNPAMREAVASYARNRDAYLYLWRHDERAPRPLVLCVHGFQMGQRERAMDLFKVKKLFHSGLDVALFVQPHHGPRAAHPDNPFRQSFINPHDVPLTIEALGQAVHDLASSYRLLEDLGYSKIGLIGASLGGYACALFAALDDSPACIFVAVPSLRLDRFLTPRRFKLGFRVDADLRRMTREALQIVAPVHYRPRMAVKDIAVVYHAGDRIADVDYTREWIQGWQIPNVTVLHGGHWAVFDGKARGRAWYEWLRRYEFLPASSLQGARA
jgi:pimeloyl-ACP methyl ester carboxylesterase